MKCSCVTATAQVMPKPDAVRRDGAAACAPPARRAPDRGRARRSRPSGHPRQPYETWRSSRPVIYRSIGVRLFWRLRPVGMHLDDGAVQRHGLQLEAHDPLALQMLEDPVEHPAPRPPVHPHVDGVPVAEPGQQPSPLAAVRGHVQDSVEHLPVRMADIAALHRKVRGNADVLSFRDLYPRMMARFA